MQPRQIVWLFAGLALAIIAVLDCSPAYGWQEVQVVGPDGKVLTVPVGQAIIPGQNPAMVPQPPGTEASPENANSQPPSDKPPQPEGADVPAVVTRDVDESQRGSKEELEVRPTADGKVSFSFRNQPWPALMQWLADISNQPLDWQELPGDYVNLASPGEYSIAETRDLFNRHLLARGFTMLELDGGITVVKTDKLNPAIVPRVAPAELPDQQPYSFIKTSFDCGWLLAPKLAEELKAMISSNGKLVALEQTNRLEAMDAAVNLQQIAEILKDEQSADAQSDLAREFEMRYIPAEEAKQMLERFLGVKEDKAAAAPQSPEMMQQMQMQMMQQQQMAGQGGGMPGMNAKKPSISIVVNSRRNSILINAPPDRMAVAAQFVKQIDVPSDSMQSLADLETRVQVFRLTTLDPAKLAEIATEMNILEPSTRMRVDEKNNALILSGSVADRYIIKTLIERLDGSARKFEVLQLRRLDAKEVAESIMFLMGTEDKKENDNNRRFMYSFWDMGRQDEKQDKDKFRVAANVRYRQVMLWANESEMAEVRNLLVKLGELPPEGGNLSRIRRVEATATPDTYEYLQRLREKFGELLPGTEIVLPPSDQFIEQKFDEDQPEGNSRPADAPDSGTSDTLSPESDRKAGLDADISQVSIGDVDYRFVRRQDFDEDATDDALRPAIRSAEEFDRVFNPARNERSRESASTGAPIKIELDDDGNLLLISDDVKALDKLENLMLDVQPPRRPYTVFKVRHASATWIVLSLEDYFGDDDASGDEEDDGFLRWLWDMPPKDDPAPEGLAGKRKLKFVSDNDTGSIVVSGASTSQLKTIAELIELWDVPEAINPRQSRYTRLITLKYSRAERVAETIKDAYRDLLSSNDRAFAQPAGGMGTAGAGAAQNRNQPRGRDDGGSELVDSEGGKTSGSSNFQFRGKLSLGVDPVGNTLLVSAEGDDLLDLVTEMINKLDQAAMPQGDLEIRDLPGAISVGTLETALRFMAPQVSGKPQPEIKTEINGSEK